MPIAVFNADDAIVELEPSISDLHARRAAGRQIASEVRWNLQPDVSLASPDRRRKFLDAATSPTTRNVCVLTNCSTMRRLSSVRSSFRTTIAMCFTSVSSAKPKAIS